MCPLVIVINGLSYLHISSCQIREKEHWHAFRANRIDWSADLLSSRFSWYILSSHLTSQAYVDTMMTSLIAANSDWPIHLASSDSSQRLSFLFSAASTVALHEVRTHRCYPMCLRVCVCLKYFKVPWGGGVRTCYWSCLGDHPKTTNATYPWDFKDQTSKLVPTERQSFVSLSQSAMLTFPQCVYIQSFIGLSL